MNSWQAACHVRVINSAACSDRLSSRPGVSMRRVTLHRLIDKGVERQVFDEQAGLVIDQRLLDSADPRGDGDHAQAAGFENGQRKPLPEGGKKQDVGPSVELGDFRGVVDRRFAQCAEAIEIQIVVSFDHGSADEAPGHWQMQLFATLDDRRQPMKSLLSIQATQEQDIQPPSVLLPRFASRHDGDDFVRRQIIRRRVGNRDQFVRRDPLGMAPLEQSD